MRKFTFLLMFLALIVFPVKGWSLPINDLYITLSEDYNGDGDAVTGLFDKIGFYDQSRSIYDVSSADELEVGVTFTDIGHALATKFRRFGALVEDREDMRTSPDVDPDFFSWELTIVWEIYGEVSNITSDVVSGRYTGGTVSIYLDESPDADFARYSDITDDNFTSFTDGVKILEGTVITGDGSFKDFSTTDNFNRTVNLLLRIDEINTDYIQSETMDLGSLVSMGWVISVATEGNDGATQIIEGDGSMIAYGEGSGTITFAAVPEPATILLVGGGLFLAGVIARRKIVK